MSKNDIQAYLCPNCGTESVSGSSYCYSEQCSTISPYGYKQPKYVRMQKVRRPKRLVEGKLKVVSAVSNGFTLQDDKGEQFFMHTKDFFNFITGKELDMSLIEARKGQVHCWKPIIEGEDADA